jgi:hypothetical protein
MRQNRMWRGSLRCRTPYCQAEVSSDVPACDVMTPHITVVMPVRDIARCLDEAIISVQAQTLADFELIIIDNGSANVVWKQAREATRTFARYIRSGLGWSARSIWGYRNRAVNSSHVSMPTTLLNYYARSTRANVSTVILRSACLAGAVQVDEQDSSVGFLKPRAVTRSRQPIPAFIDKSRQYSFKKDGPLSARFRRQQLFSARLVQRVARARHAGARDLTSEVTAAPNWREAESVKSFTKTRHAANMGANDEYVKQLQYRA